MRNVMKSAARDLPNLVESITVITEFGTVALALLRSPSKSGLLESWTCTRTGKMEIPEDR
jgi:hypothetical protein